MAEKQKSSDCLGNFYKEYKYEGRSYYFYRSFLIVLGAMVLVVNHLLAEA